MKLFGRLLIIVGFLFGCASLWSVNKYLTVDTSTEAIISVCKDRISAGSYDKWEGDKARRLRCLEDGWISMGMVYPLYITFISVFGIFSIIFLLSGWWVVRRKKSATSS